MWEMEGMPRLQSDAWVQENPLSSYLITRDRDAHETEKNKLVRDYWNETVGWDWNALPNLPENVRECMDLISLEGDDNIDVPAWKGEVSGMFSVNSAYDLITNSETNLQDLGWSTCGK